MAIPQSCWLSRLGRPRSVRCVPTRGPEAPLVEVLCPAEGGSCPPTPLPPERRCSRWRHRLSPGRASPTLGRARPAVIGLGAGDGGGRPKHGTGVPKAARGVLRIARAGVGSIPKRRRYPQPQPVSATNSAAVRYSREHILFPVPGPGRSLLLPSDHTGRSLFLDRAGRHRSRLTLTKPPGACTQPAVICVAWLAHFTSVPRMICCPRQNA